MSPSSCVCIADSKPFSLPFFLRCLRHYNCFVVILLHYSNIWFLSITVVPTTRCRTQNVALIDVGHRIVYLRSIFMQQNRKSNDLVFWFIWTRVRKLTITRRCGYLCLCVLTQCTTESASVDPRCIRDTHLLFDAVLPARDISFGGFVATEDKVTNVLQACEGSAGQDASIGHGSKDNITA